MPRTAAAPPRTPEELQRVINARFGANVMKFASDPYFVIERIPSGILALDCALSGGFARGRHIEIFGTNNVGKTAITYRTIGQAQDDGLNCSFIDVEGTFDPNFAESQGVDLGRLSITDQHELENGHRVIDFLEVQLRSEIYDVIVLDSIASLLPMAEHGASMEDTQVAEQARLMSKALRKLTAANRKTVLMYINQTRESVGGSVFQKRTVTSGGKAMLFYAGMRLELVRTENIKRKGSKVNINTGEVTKADQIKGHRILVKVEKDKTGSAANGSETTMVFDYDIGTFDPIEDLLYMGRKHGLIKKSGSRWWLADYPEDKIAGRPKFKTFLRRNDLLAEELQEAIEAAAYAEREDVVLEEDDEADDD